MREGYASDAHQLGRYAARRRRAILVTTILDLEAQLTYPVVEGFTMAASIKTETFARSASRNTIGYSRFQLAHHPWSVALHSVEFVMRIAASEGPKVPYPNVLAGVTHGSHVCAFYETTDDLLDLVLPFFAAGRDRGELCVWITPDSISEDEARIRASKVVDPALEFHTARDLYLRRQRFQRDPVIHFWDEKLQQALAAHRSGMHASGDAFWLQRNDWNAFLDYEADLNTMIAGKPITLLCTYPFSLSKIADAFDVARAHQFAIAKRQHEWEVVAPPAVNPDRLVEAADAAARVSSLTPRERQVLDAVIDGHPNKVLAHDLAVDVRTIEAHRAHLMRRLGVRTMVEAVRLGTLAKFAAHTPLSGR